MDLVGDSIHSEIGDSFNVTNTPASGLLTELSGGVGYNVFDIIHGGVNQNIAIIGGSGNNQLELDRSQSSAAAPDSVVLASGSKGPGSLLNAVSITGSATSITMTGVYTINVSMYGGTLDAGDLRPDGEFNIDVTGKASPAGDANHVVIEPPSAGTPDNAGIGTGPSIADFATLTQYEITGFVAQDDIRLKINGGGSETVNDPETLGPYTLIIDGQRAPVPKIPPETC